MIFMSHPLAPYLDFANHHPNAVEADIKFVSDQVTKHGFNSAFMNPSWVEFVRQTLGYTGRVGTIVAFSLGQDTLDIKVAAAKRYLEAGTNELDILLNISQIKEAKWDAVFTEMQTLMQAIKSVNPEVTVKFVPECGYLNPDEIKKVAELMVRAQADFFKTCTGMGPRGANLDDVRFIKAAVGDQIKIKVAGGVDTPEEAQSYLAAGVSRMGTSHALEIIGAVSPTPTSTVITE
jgi:deoxyribose-phosphate aldolase